MSKQNIESDYIAGFKAGYFSAGKLHSLADLDGFDSGYVHGYANGWNASGKDGSVLGDRIIKLFEDYCILEEEANLSYNDGYLAGLSEQVQNIEWNNLTNSQFKDVVLNTLNECLDKINAAITSNDTEKLAEYFIYQLALNFHIASFKKLKECLKVD